MAEYIDREAIEYPYMTMTLWGLNAATCHAYNEGVKAAADAIAAIHAADVVEVVRGRWIETKRGFHCSNCKKQPGLHTIKRGVLLSDFCPNCGADMREEV